MGVLGSSDGTSGIGISGQTTAVTGATWGGSFTSNASSDGIAILLNGGKAAIQTSFNTAPATPTSTGTSGEVRFTTDAIYVATATNTWKKADLTPTRQTLLTNDATLDFTTASGTWATIDGMQQNTTLTFTVAPDFAEGLIRVKQDATGNRTLAFAETVAAITSLEYDGGFRLINPDASTTTVIKYVVDETTLRLSLEWYE